jgi:hypothetical protein
VDGKHCLNFVVGRHEFSATEMYPSSPEMQEKMPGQQGNFAALANCKMQRRADLAGCNRSGGLTNV